MIAFLGLTGSGGVFHMQEVRLGNAVAQIPRVARWEASDEIRITFNAPRGDHNVTVGMGFFDRFEIGYLQPEPQASTLTSSGHRMRFAAELPSPHGVHISIRPMHFGWTSFTLELDGESRTVHVLIVP
ncbi:hypothetical protein [Paracoccus aestuariivivens]|uniref:Uncharacterized protein n=1 Tax=Paracoccus aestuariivivens TaxID=1820333 RepID=A0A6L6JEJ6_9RHOB|nr:hypothetical protein [Paracoccus aestuariivivens]MTH79936.1 hypothetical protein [Paracoccus aestuariivivens]